MAQFEELSAGELTVTDKVKFAGKSNLTGATIGIPAAGTITAKHEDAGVFVRSTFTLTEARVPVIDGAGSGSYGSLVLFTFPAGSVSFLGSRQNYTAFAEGAALTTGAGDAVHLLALGTVAVAAAADGALTGTSVDIGNATAQITNVAGTGAATKHTGAGAVKDGTSTAATLNLNWSGTAATIDATSTIDVTGTITVLWSLMGDD